MTTDSLQFYLVIQRMQTAIALLYPKLTQPGHPSVGGCSKYQRKLGRKQHTTQCTSPVSEVWYTWCLAGSYRNQRRSMGLADANEFTLRPTFTYCCILLYIR